jgi:type IV secretory pathway VirB2 component (pilin)
MFLRFKTLLRGLEMNTLWTAIRRWRHATRVGLAFLVGLFPATSAFAQATGTSPWENAVGVLQQAFTSTIARGLSLVAIVVSGLTFAFARSRPTSVIP